MRYTDLAAELTSRTEKESLLGKIKTSQIVLDKQKAKIIGKRAGKYITLTLNDTADFTHNRDTVTALYRALCEFDFPKTDILVAGLGNRDITPDSLGVLTAEGVLATRGTPNFSTAVSVIHPGVGGQTGFCGAEVITSLVKSFNIKGVIAIDALLCEDLSRLFCTVQLTDSGIVPGSGVGNKNLPITKEALGIPIIAIGVPTCIAAESLFGSRNTKQKGERLIVAPKDCNITVKLAARTLSSAINRFLFRNNCT